MAILLLSVVVEEWIRQVGAQNYFIEYLSKLQVWC